MLNGPELGRAIKIAIDRKIESKAINSIADVARHFGVKPPSVHGWIKTGAISKDKLPDLWRYFSDVAGPEHWGLATWPIAGVFSAQEQGADYVAIRGQNRPKNDALSNRAILVWEHEDELPSGDYAMIPRLSIHLSAGNGRAAIDVDKKKPQAFRADWIRARRLKPKYLTCMEAAGESMAPWVNHGDSLVIDTSDRNVRDGEAYALRYGNELRVKRLFVRFDRALVLRSDNPDKHRYPDEVILSADLDHVEVIGRVVWRGG